MTRILHISSDYPDEIDSHKTRAVSNLVGHAKNYEHCVYSLNRTNWPGRKRVLRNDNNLYSIAYLGFPYGLFLRSFKKCLAKELYGIIRRDNLKPDIIHCHKLTFEGIVGFELSRRLGVPLVCSVRGDTDLKVIKFKPTYSNLYHRILDHSARVFFIAPWTLNKIRQWHGESVDSKSVVLPNIVGLEFGGQIPDQVHSRTLVTVCHLKDYRRKNIARIIRAVDRCISMGNDIYLDIIGGGPETLLARARGDIKRCRNPDRFRLRGGLDHSAVISSLRQYAGLILPSYPETFGMVYLEALQSGIPFVHSRGAGVDGYFSEYKVSASVDPRSIESIQHGIIELLRNQCKYKNNIRRIVEAGYLNRFNTGSIVTQYEKNLDAIL